jgi:cell volume regulation protein A
MDTPSVFLIIGTIIIIGFLGNLAFKKTKVPDILLLLGIGILLGPVLKIFNVDKFTSFAEYFGAFALIIILFEGGMDLAIERVVKEFGAASLLVIIAFFLTALSITAFLYYAYHWDIIRSLLFGAIFGCTSAAIVIPVAGRMSLSREVQTILSVESALSDVLAIIFTVYILEFVTLKHIGINAPFRAVASSFSVAIVLGGFAGFLWLKILDLIKEQKYSYMITLSAILITYALIEFFGGSGPIAVLIFGIILGNSNEFIKFMKLKKNIVVDDTIKFFHGEVSFFIRTFFFVYIGMMVSFKFINTNFLLLTAAVVGIIIIARYVTAEFICFMFPEKKNEKSAIVAMLPRGLASAVLASFPVSANIKGSEDFIGYAFTIIVLTNIIMTAGVFIVEKKTHNKRADVL